MLRFRNLFVESIDLLIPKKHIEEICFVCRGEEDSYIKIVKTNGATYRMPISEVSFDGIKVDGHKQFLKLLPISTNI